MQLNDIMGLIGVVYFGSIAVGIAISSLRLEKKWEKESEDELKAFVGDLKNQYPELYLDWPAPELPHKKTI